MSDDTVTSLLGSFAEALADPEGYEPNKLEAISRDAPAPLPSFAKAVLSSDGDLLMKTIEELAALASKENCFDAWFNLGVLAHRLFFTQAAICYYERSLDLAETQKDGKNAAKALNNLGSLYAEGEDWDRASEHYRRGLKHLEEEGDLRAALPLLKNLGDVHRMRDELDQALKCYEKALTATDGGTSTAEVLNSLGKLHQLKGDSSKALEFYQKGLTESERVGDKGCKAKSLANLGSVHRMNRDWDQSLDCYEMAMRTLEELEDRAGMAEMENNLGRRVPPGRKIVPGHGKLPEKPGHPRLAW